MKRHISRSATAFTIFAFSALSVICFVAPQTAPAQSRVLRADTRKAEPVEQFGTLTPTAPAYNLDMGSLGIEPSIEMAAPQSAGVAAGGAHMSIAPEVVPTNTTGAAVIVGSGFNASENVNILINGTLITSLAANANGYLAISLNSTTAGFLLIEYQGVTSGKRVAGVTEISATGPFVSGLAGGPHAINTTLTNRTMTFQGAGFPPSTSVSIKRNGVALGALTSTTAGLIGFTLAPAPNGDTAAVYTADVVATPGTMAGISIEERADAGALPAEDQNVSRAFVNRAVLNNTTGGFVAYVGEGFTPGENVTVSCSGGTVVADPNGSVSQILTFAGPVAAGNVLCALNGVTSLRVARFAVRLDPQVTNYRSIIVAPAFTRLGGTVKVLATGLPANDTGQIFIDGVLTGTALTDASGNGTVTIPKPANTFAHAVVWVTSTGLATAAPLMMNLPTAGEVSLSGRVVSDEGRGITGTRVTVSGASLAEPISVVTGRRGEFSFEGLTAGETYIVSVSARRYTFEESTRVITLNDNAAGVDFTATSR